MIRRLEIEHFKSIERLNLDLTPVTILVGNNGVGKSNVIDALRLLKDAVTYDLDRAVSDRHGIDCIRQWARSKPYHVRISVDYLSSEAKGRFSVTLGSSRGNFKIIREEGSWHDNVLEGRFREKDGKEQFTESAVNRYTNYTRDIDGKVQIVDYRGDQVEQGVAQVEYKDSLFLTDIALGALAIRRRNTGLTALRRQVSNFEAYSIYPNTLRAPQTPSNETRLGASGANLTSVFKYMSRSNRAGVDNRSEIVDALRAIMPNLDTITIQGVGGVMVPLFKVKDQKGSKTHQFNVSQISDGTLRVFGLLTALYQPNKPSVIALEEPEQTVNPGVLAVIADAIKEVSGETQVIVTTHSPNFIDHFDPTQIRAAEMVDGITQVGPINSSQLDAVKKKLFTLGELMTAEGLAT